MDLSPSQPQGTFGMARMGATVVVHMFSSDSELKNQNIR